MSADESAMNTSLLSTNSEQELVSPVKKRVVARVGGRALQTTPSRRSVRFADDTLDGDESDDSRGRHSSGSSRSSSPTITVGASGARGGSRGGVHRLQSRGDSAAMLTTDSETDGGAATPAATDTPTRRAGGSLADMFRPAGSQLKGAPAPLAPATLAAAPASAVALGAAAVPAASVAQDSSSSTGLRGAGLPGPAAAAPAGAGGAGALKYRTINERAAVASVAASPSRPDAPNVEDMLRRISVVLLQHMHRGERAAVGGLGLDSGASSSAASNGTGNAAGGAGAGGLAPGVSGSPVLASTAARVRAASMAADAAADSLLGAGDSPAAGSGSAGAGASACEAAASCPSLIGCCGIGSATGLGAFQGPSFHASLTAASSPAYATVASIARTLVSPNGWLRLLGVGAWCGVTGGSIFDCGGSGKSSSSSDGSGSSGGAAMGSSWGTGWCGLGSRPPLCCRSGKGKGEDEEDEGADALVGAGKAPPKGEWDTTSSEDEYAGPRARAATTSSTGTAASRAGGGRASGVAAGAAPSSSSSDPKPRPPPTLEEIYDDEVEGDEFHEARFLRPQYAVLHTDPGFNGFFGGGASTIIVKQRYAFSMPSSSDIYDFMLRLFKRAHLTAESSIISLVYIERLMETSRITLRAHNWRPIVLCGLMLASKVWDDLCSWSVEFAAIYPQYTVHAINAMERAFVSKLTFNLYISGSVYARYYFALRALNEQRGFRQRYANMVSAAATSGAAAPSGGGGAVPVPVVKKIEESSQGLRASLYSRSL